MNRLVLTIAAAGLFGLGGSAWAQGVQQNTPHQQNNPQQPNSSQQQNRISQQDTEFAQKAAESGKGEVAASQLALSKAANEPTRQFARTLVNDHQMANAQLERIAETQGLQLPAQPSPTDQKEMNDLRGLDGPAFDKAFGQNEVKDHEKAIALFEQEAQSGTDPALRAFAENTIATLRQHLQTARQVALGS